jgi:hypothetical protein
MTTSSLQGQNLLLNKRKSLQSGIILGGKLSARSLRPGWKVDQNFFFLLSADSVSSRLNTHVGLASFGLQPRAVSQTLLLFNKFYSFKNEVCSLLRMSGF